MCSPGGGEDWRGVDDQHLAEDLREVVGLAACATEPGGVSSRILSKRVTRHGPRPEDNTRPGPRPEDNNAPIKLAMCDRDSLESIVVSLAPVGNTCRRV